MAYRLIEYTSVLSFTTSSYSSCALSKINCFSCHREINQGQKVVLTRGKTRCEGCDDGYFQPVENRSQECRVCTICDEGKRDSMHTNRLNPHHKKPRAKRIYPTS